ncbi:Lrp/AsnC family transcriptional regulator [Nonomuraea sp. NPDC050022]|uniref:Lrp/AsnC family transcriptional regulator n=1 Tax=unclassified Nonomuraea TaxID=2593643 RepID=UPI0033CBFD2F
MRRDRVELDRPVTQLGPPQETHAAGAIVEPAEVSAGTAAFVALRFNPEPGAKAEVNAALEREPCVLEVHEVAGEDCYLIKVRVGATVELADALDRIRAIPAISHTNSTVVLRTVFERPITIDAGQRH